MDFADLTVGKALAAVTLWDSKRFCTVTIAQLLNIHEAAVERVLHIVREERRVRQ